MQIRFFSNQNWKNREWWNELGNSEFIAKETRFVSAWKHFDAHSRIWNHWFKRHL